jgi:hypothetical protein
MGHQDKIGEWLLMRFNGLGFADYVSWDKFRGADAIAQCFQFGVAVAPALGNLAI